MDKRELQLDEKKAQYEFIVNRIIVNCKLVVKTAYQIGLDLKDIQERELYLFDCRDFKEFLRTRVKIGRSTAYFLIQLVSEYSITEFEKWGFKKLVILKGELEEEKDRKDFINSNPVYSVRQLPEEINQFRLEKNIQETKRFSKQVGSIPKHSSSQEEHLFKLEREFNKLEEQYNQINALKTAFKEACERWLSAAAQYDNLTTLKIKVEIYKND